ncbi:MAG: nuclear transport factor 2 family protein [Rubrobacteraceae bacterium]|nr:nuclear transport factor 2 family protein [Rubrobacteraceae bacterium]
MKERKADRDLDFEALRYAIEQCDPNLLPGFYTEDAQLSIVNADARRSMPFELCGKGEIAKHLRAVYGQGASHRIEGEVVGEDLVRFREACEYPDGGRVLVETILEVHDGKIVRQADVVAKNAHSDPEKGISRGPPPRTPNRGPAQGRTLLSQIVYYAPSRQPKRRI